MEPQFYSTNGGTQMPIQGLQTLFALLELPYDFTKMGASTFNKQKSKSNIRNDFAYWLSSYEESDNRSSMNFFCPAIK